MAFLPVRDHHAILTTHLLVEPLLPHLKQHNWLLPSDHEALTKRGLDRKKKVEMIAAILKRKNGRVWCDEAFLRCVLLSDQKEVAKKLGYVEHDAQEMPSYPLLQPAINTSVAVGDTATSQPPVVLGTGRRRIPSHEVHHYAFIVYSKEDDPYNRVIELSDFLTHCGVDCDIDQYHTNENILDWGLWNEEEIKKCISREGFVLLVCSPRLHQQLCDARNSSRIEMRAGHLTNLTLNSLIKDSHITQRVIPVFLEQYRMVCVPTCVAERTCYALNWSRMVNCDPTAEASVILNTPGLESLRSLVCRLRKEPESVKPEVVTTPGPICTSSLGPFPPVVVPQETPSPVQQLPIPKSPTEAVDGEVPDDFLHEVANNIGKDWSRLGVRLGIPFRTLEMIRHSAPYDMRQQAYLMLVHWKETHKTLPTIVELQDKLDELKLGRIGRLYTNHT